MGFHDEALSLVGSARLFCALSTEGAWCPAPFHVRHAGRGVTLLGTLPARAARGSRGARARAALPAPRDPPGRRHRARDVAQARGQLHDQRAHRRARLPERRAAGAGRGGPWTSRPCAPRRRSCSRRSASMRSPRNCRPPPPRSRAAPPRTAPRCCRTCRPAGAPRSTTSTVSCAGAPKPPTCPAPSTAHCARGSTRWSRTTTSLVARMPVHANLRVGPHSCGCGTASPKASVATNGDPRDVAE